MPSQYLVNVVQFRTRPAAVVGLLPQPLRANFDAAATRLAAARPVGPLAEFTVGRTGDDARLLNVACREEEEDEEDSSELAAHQARGQLQFFFFLNGDLIELLL